MEIVHGFECKREQTISEIGAVARLWECTTTGAEVLSLANDDENKVFGAVFRTPADDSTGVAHILEHSVLCGSKNYPVKEPFVELLKGSMQTFLNAFTFPDKTCYPVASTHPQDFHNLIRVYLDAVFFPRITEDIFKQEGWHLEPDRDDPVNGPLAFKGVVYNEMKGAYSSPDSLLAEYVQHSIFPDTTYGNDSGGHPAHIPDLTYAQFKRFHEDYYHPSNGRFFFSGDDNEQERLALLRDYLDQFERREVDSSVAQQEGFDGPKNIEKYYPASVSDGDAGRAMVACSWLLSDTMDPETVFAMAMLEHLLIGLPGSPLYKALIDSGLGEDLAGVGLEPDLKQLYFSVGLKGIRQEDAAAVERVIDETLRELADKGPSAEAVEAAVNSVEFDLRENNTGRFPRGLHLMLRSLTVWLYDGDPFALLAFEKPLESIKKRLADGEPVFQDMIRTWLIENSHRTTVLLAPDVELGERQRRAEQEQLETLRAELGPEGMQQALEDAIRLQQQQELPDPPELLATIPRLERSDLSPENTVIPREELREAGVDLLFHDLETNGVAYLDLAFDLADLEGPAMALIPLLAKAFTDMDTQRRDFVEFSTLQARKTGGVWTDTIAESRLGDDAPVLRLVMRAKATPDKAPDMLDIVREALLETRLDDPQRFKQMVLEEKARLEHRLVPAGHMMTLARLRGRFSRAGLEGERMDGVTQLMFLRRLAKDVESDWPRVLAGLEALRAAIIHRAGCIANVTMDREMFAAFRPKLGAMLGALAEKAPAVDEASLYVPAEASPSLPEKEGLSIPAEVNYVGKGANLDDLGYDWHGAAVVASRLLRNSYLWDQIRVQGGAYGAFCYLNRFDRTVAMVSYRDPNLARTLDVFDKAGEYLATLDLSQDELDKAVIGAVSDIDGHMLPDAKGYASLVRMLTGDDEPTRQKLREDVLAVTPAHFRTLGETLKGFAAAGRISVLGGGETLAAEAATRGWDVQNIL